MFENVNYQYYTETMKRDIVPSEADFEKYTEENLLYFKKILPFLNERESGGIDAACCLCIEEQYKAESSGQIVTSESIGGFSQSFDTSRIKTLEQNRRKWIELYCDVYTGVK